MNADDITKLQAYLKKTLNDDIVLKTRPKAKDSAELYLGDEFLAVVYKDEDEGEVAYQFQMTVLSEDIKG